MKTTRIDVYTRVSADQHPRSSWLLIDGKAPPEDVQVEVMTRVNESPVIRVDGGRVLYPTYMFVDDICAYLDKGLMADERY